MEGKQTDAEWLRRHSHHVAGSNDWSVESINRLRSIADRLERLEEACRVYADKGNWTDAGEYATHQRDWIGPEGHGYDIARSALLGDSHAG